jgi:hypothetical protein
MIELPPLPEILTKTAREFADAWAMPGGRAHTDAMSNLEAVVRAYGETCARAALEAAAVMLDSEHECRKHADNHAAFYALKVRALATPSPGSAK